MKTIDVHDPRTNATMRFQIEGDAPNELETKAMRRALDRASDETTGAGFLRTLASQAATDLGQFAKDAQYAANATAADLDHNTANAFLLADRMAQKLSDASGLSYGGAFSKVESFFRNESQEFARRALDQGDAPNLSSKIVRTALQVPGGVAQAVAAAAVAGPVAGFAGLGALSAADRGPGAMALEAAKQAAMGKLLGATSGAGRVSRIATVGAGQAALSVASGERGEDTALSAATMGALAGFGKPGVGATRIRELADLRAQQIADKVEAFTTGRARDAIKRGQAEAAQIEAERPAVEPLEIHRDAVAQMQATQGEAAPVPMPKRSVNLNLDRIEGPEDYRAAQARVVEFFRGNIDEARRGEISLAETEGMARDLGMSVDDLLARRKGQSFNAEEITASRTIMQSSFSELMKEASKARDPATATPEGNARLFKAMALFEGTIEQTLGATAEAGRALSALRILSGPTVKDMKGIRNALTILGEQRARGVPVEELADMISSLRTPGEAMRVLREMRKATTSEKVIEAWINWGLLSGPQTHAVNVLSNAATSLWTIPETVMAGSVGAVRSGIRKAMGGAPTERVFLSEAPARLFGLVMGARDGLRLAGRALMSGQSSDEFATKLDSPHAAIGGQGGSVARLPSRLLIAEDDLFKAIGFRQELYARAVRRASSEGLSGRSYWERVQSIVKEPPKEIVDAAHEAARYQTFTTQLGKIGNSVLTMSRAHPLMTVVLPFVRTPTNIIKYAAERTPAAALMRPVRDAIRAGGAAGDTAAGRLAFASMIGAWVTTEALQGHITGSGPTNPALREEWLTRHRPYSFEFQNQDGTTRSVSYARIEPLASVIGLTADFASVLGHIDDPDVRDRAASGLAVSIQRNLTNKTFISGMTRAVLAMNDPEGYGEGFAEGLARTVVPNIIGQVNQQMDPLLREVHGIVDAVKSRVPEYSEDLPPRRNVWGEAIALDRGIGPDILSPLYSHQFQNDPASAEVVRVGASLTSPRAEAKQIPLDPIELDQLRVATGKRAKQWVDRLVGSPEYQRLPDGSRKEMIEKLYGESLKLARTEIFAEITRKNPGRAAQPILDAIEAVQRTAVPIGEAESLRRATQSNP